MNYLAKIIILYGLSVGILFPNNSEISYLRFFENDYYFKADLSMLSSDRRGKAHLAVSYDERDRPVKIERVSKTGVTKKREMLKYDITGKLIERGEYTDRWKYLSLIVYGEDEPWSKEYRAWRFRVNEPLSFVNQQTYFTVKDGVQVSKIIFQTVDGQKYGQIELDYDYLGNLKEERWRDLPSARVIRRFRYKFEADFGAFQEGAGENTTYMW